MKFPAPVLLLLAVTLILGCTIGKKEPETIQEKVRQAKEIQEEYEDAYAALQRAIAEGDAEEAKRSYSELLSAYRKAVEKAGKRHMDFFVDEGALRTLGAQVDSGKLEAANATLSSITSSCGVSVCHMRTGGAMANLEYEYSRLKDALDEGNMSAARERFPAFKRYFYESREATEKFLPELTRERMKEEYVTALENALEQDNLTAAREAMQVISERTCSLNNGCHAMLLTVGYE
ncbi:MAG: hypothetical protein GXN98_02940 [Euryarchaeota archaeon]|nr:hypothetical protein [Euryarchaeota archaeon]